MVTGYLLRLTNNRLLITNNQPPNNSQNYKLTLNLPTSYNDGIIFLSKLFVKFKQDKNHFSDLSYTI